MGGFMKVSVVWTKLIRTISVSTYKESERVMSPWPCLPSAPCHLGHGGRGRGHGWGEKNPISWTVKKTQKQELQSYFSAWEWKLDKLKQ